MAAVAKAMAWHRCSRTNAMIARDRLQRPRRSHQHRHRHCCIAIAPHHAIAVAVAVATASDVASEADDHSKSDSDKLTCKMLSSTARKTTLSCSLSVAHVKCVMSGCASWLRYKGSNLDCMYAHAVG